MIFSGAETYPKPNFPSDSYSGNWTFLSASSRGISVRERYTSVDMATCPCCGQALPSAAEPNELCSACSSAMDTGVDSGPASDAGVFAEPPVPRKRPMGVTMLAWTSFAGAALFVVFAVVILADPLQVPDTMKLDVPLVDRALVAGVFLCFAVLEYLCGLAFWRLRNWVRVLAIALGAIDLVLPEPRSWIVSRAFSLLVFWYLLQPHIREAFNASPSGSKSLQAAERLQ